MNPNDFSEIKINYVKYPKILYTKISDTIAYANIVDPDQTSLVRVYIVYHST